MNLRRSESGQAIVLMTLSLAVILGMAVLVLDVGNWFHTKRRLQGTADAAALAGAQQLPNDPGGAQTMAATYAGKNGGDVAGADITVSTTVLPNDTISVRARKLDPGFFGGMFGVTSADISARAKVRVGPPAQARYVAPMVVYCGQSLIKNCDGKGSPTFGVPTTLDYDKMGAPGAFGMLDLEGTKGAVGSKEEAQWILTGFDKYLPIGIYNSDPGAKFNSSNIQDALTARIGTVLLFPVFKTLTGSGSGAEYDIIGWIGFRLTGFEVKGTNATLEGSFTEFIAQGILATSSGGGSGPSSTWGVKSIQLIE
ncbi:MAG: hypothetical protein QOE13_2986 [Gaiellaceae bacterium]|jgi:Flp pilus assembly protein TadG|nr:hypothetical protein [Gaiellaceae bacterium]